MTSLTPDPKDPSVLSPENSIAPVLAADEKGTMRSQPHQLYSFAAAGWLTILAVPLLAFPRVLALIFGSLLTESELPDGEGKAEIIRQLNILERTLAGFAGFACLALALILIIQTGAVPLHSHVSDPALDDTPDAPFRIPTTVVTVLFFSAIGWYSYDLGLWLVTGFSAVLAAWGTWAVLFANESIVNKEGRKTNVSTFPFKNAAAEEQKKTR